MLLIDSMPPATATSMSPVAMPWAASMTAFRPGAADLVDRERGDGLRQSAAERRLPGGRLAEPGGDDVAHDALVDDGRVDAGSCDGLAHDERAELRGGEFLERSQELTRRESDGADDDGFAHGPL